LPTIPVGNPAGTIIWSSDPLLLPQNPRSETNPNGITPPFGANGIEFSPPECTPGVGGCALLVANTANRQIVRMFCCDLNNKALPATVLINGVNGPDGIAVDKDTGFIWVAANQSDEIVVIQPSTGTNVLPRVIAKLGDFNGINNEGRVRGFLFPTSLAIGTERPPKAGKFLAVANSAFTSAFAIDTEWGNLVTRYTVARMPFPTITGCPANPIPLPPPCGLFR
jgi:hypothetical protein